MKRTTTVIGGLALLLANASFARAQDGGFNDTVSRAMQAYQNRKYAEAIRGFERAYELRPQPELVYNIARAHEKALQSEEAIEAYERFLALPGTTADLRAKALNSLGALKREQAAKRAAAAPPPPPPPNIVPPPSGGDVTSGPPPTVRTTPKTSKSRVLEFALIGTGAAAIVAGGVFGVLALNANGDFEDEKDKPMPNVPRLESLQSDVDRNAAIADIAIIGGVVLGTVGVVLLVVGGDDDDELALQAGVSPGGFAITGRF